MKWISGKWMLFLGCFICASCVVFRGTSSPNDKELVAQMQNLQIKNEKRIFKSLTLANNLEVLLISSKEFNKSSAAIDVAVGYLEDPETAQGIAHFLEHLLFLGTQKYPDVAEYKEFISTHQGMSNAFTADEHTNYLFEINHDAYEGALDRFSQFFIAPLFDKRYVEKEMNAVHSEHQKNIDSDLWRINQIVKGLSDHPRKKFGTGTLETLGKVSREAVVEFFNQYYSANQMKLVMMSNYPLEQMEKWAVEKFSPILNKNRKNLEYSTQVFSKNQLPQFVQIKSLKDLRELTLSFILPSQNSYWVSKPLRSISYLVGHEGRGSLLSLLKKKNYATSLSSGSDSYSYSAEFTIKIDLTPLGQENLQEIITYFFNYMNLLREKGLPEHIYNELETMAKIGYQYKEHEEGAYTASSFAGQMHLFPALEIEKRSELFYEFRLDDFNKMLSYIVPENLTSILVDRNVSTDKVEEFYKAEYKVESVSKETQKSWAIVKSDASELRIPSVNKYIPKTLDIYGEEDTIPQKIVDDQRGVIWLARSKSFNQPKARVSFLLNTPVVNASPRNKVLAYLYQKSVLESINEWLYEVSLAGLSFNLNHDEKGFYLEFSGFSEHLNEFILDLVPKLKEVSITEEIFASLKDDYKRDLGNIEFNNAYQKLMYEMSFILQKDAIHYKEEYDPKNNIDLISSVTLDEIKNFHKQLFEKIGVEALFSGNLKDKPSVNKSYSDELNGVLKALNSTSLNRNAYKKEEIIKLPNEKSYYAFQTGNSNYCWGSVFQFEGKSIEKQALLRLGHAMINSDFYTTLRSEQQLGYIVHSGLSLKDTVIRLLFLIQSSTYSPLEIETRVNHWNENIRAKIESASNFEFEAYRDSIIKTLKEEDKTIYDRHSSLFFESVIMGGQFNYKEHIADAVSKATQKQVIQIFKEVLENHKSSGLNVWLFKENEKMLDLPKNLHFISNVKKFKEKVVY